MMTTNLKLAEKVLVELLTTGVKEICLCAGARNSPFVLLLDGLFPFKVYHFFEERSAGFFALGRVAATLRPVAVITTSGTAVGELLPAAIEGTYSSLPLIMISADRPKSYRGSGAPQTIDQVGIFSYYIEATFDLDMENTHFSLKSLSWRKPVHVNVCFQEPLLDSEVPTALDFPKERRVTFTRPQSENDVVAISSFFKTHRPLAIVGTLPEKSREPMGKFLSHLGCPLYLEGPSGLRGHPALKSCELFGGDSILRKILRTQVCDSVVRIGGVPTTRVWRDFEDLLQEVPILSVGYNHYTGLSRQVQHFTSIESLVRAEVQVHNSATVELMAADRKAHRFFEELLKKYPLSEHAMVRAYSECIKNDNVFLGNSLPVREWDMAASPDYCPKRIAASRGANGIDGQISTFFGWARPDAMNWALFGDLTTMYDLSAPWVCSQMETNNLRIGIINNSGGRIFERIFRKDIFINAHDIEFSHWAKMWNWEYFLWQSPQEMTTDLPQRCMIEMRPNLEQTATLLNEWDQYWKNDV